eukprot:TRINITY_DN2160_c0_g1_i1.p1 TRINITY_DN2160_c0_g1~~TRINITY_DN2160_c0_g1_i1.p1  ORF type:complete len:408 (+),score=103.89 TRINITY_DN2160_c0_g1_i1:162-1226(+)
MRGIMTDPQKRKSFEQSTGVSLDSFFKEQEKANHKKTGQIFWENLEGAVRRDEEVDKKEEKGPLGNLLKKAEEETINIPLWLGILLLCWIVIQHSRGEKEILANLPPDARLASPETVGKFSYIPTRFLSQLWGSFTNIQFPSAVETKIINAYAYAFGCNLEEAEKEVSEYPSLAHFFRRNLKPGARPIESQAQMISPVDGRMLHFGEIESENQGIEQVKGIRFSLKDFLGEDSEIFDVIKKQQIHNKQKGERKKHLYYCIIYLAPGDYHGYHSPVDWKIKERVHYPGYLYPVANWAVNLIRGLFAMNERVVLTGEWEHGYFSYTPVGAYNVGSMSLKFEEVSIREKIIGNIRED